MALAKKLTIVEMLEYAPAPRSNSSERRLFAWRSLERKDTISPEGEVRWIDVLKDISGLSTIYRR